MHQMHPFNAEFRICNTCFGTNATIFPDGRRTGAISYLNQLGFFNRSEGRRHREQAHPAIRTHNW
jgi:hypothetical protein